MNPKRELLWGLWVMAFRIQHVTVSALKFIGCRWMLDRTRV